MDSILQYTMHFKIFNNKRKNHLSLQSHCECILLLSQLSSAIDAFIAVPLQRFQPRLSTEQLLLLIVH